MELSKEQSERYSRQLILNEIGTEGQKKLMNASVLIIGAGGLGSPVALYLAAAGVGTIGIADADRVDLSNLQRQIIHSSYDLGKEKVLSAKETMENLNPDICVNTYNIRITSDNINQIITNYDFIIDATDNFDTKFLINDACVLCRKPFVHAGIMGFSGQVMTYIPDNETPCYRCIFRNPPSDGSVPKGRRLGVIGAVAGTIGSIQAMEAIKYISGSGELLTGSLLTYDSLKMDFRKIKLPHKSDDCPVCGFASKHKVRPPK